MGAMKEHPKYNILSCRVSDSTKGLLVRVLRGRTVQSFIHDAIEEKIAREAISSASRLRSLCNDERSAA